MSRITFLDKIGATLGLTTKLDAANINELKHSVNEMYDSFDIVTNQVNSINSLNLWIPKDAKANKAAIVSAYPTPALNWAAMALDDGYIYVNNGGGALSENWVNSGQKQFPVDVLTTKDFQALQSSLPKLHTVQSTSYTYTNSYVNYTDGSVTPNSDWHLIEITDIKPISISTTMIGGSIVALISYFNGNTFLGYQEKGTTSSIVKYEDLVLEIPFGTTKILVCTSIANAIVVKNVSILNSASKIDIDVVNGLLHDYEISKTPYNYTNSYVDYTDGSVNANSDWHLIEINEIMPIKISTKLTGGNSIALASYFNGSTFLGYQEKGTPSSTVIYDDLLLIIPSGTTKIIICTNIENEIVLKDIQLLPALNTAIEEIQTWGDSITYAGEYQIGIANKLGIDISKIKNCGIRSDYSSHIRNRFVSYFTQASPYIGTGEYSIPTFGERKVELNNSFFVFWLGTNNLINPNRTSGEYTTGNSSYTALQPTPNFKYDRMYSKSYSDMFLNDIREMISIIPHSNFAIICGHGGFMATGEMRDKMISLDETITRIFPRNVINIRELLIMKYDYQNTFIAENFIKPSIGNSVNIKLTNCNWVGNDKNTSFNICVGTKEIYDKYHVTAVNSELNIVSATLTESNTEFSTGEEILASYDLVSDLGRDLVNIKTRCYSYEDCLSYLLKSMPYSCTDPIHPNSAAYLLIGELISEEMNKIKKSI